MYYTIYGALTLDMRSIWHSLPSDDYSPLKCKQLAISMYVTYYGNINVKLI
jgi:hypothetical protein